VIRKVSLTPVQPFFIGVTITVAVIGLVVVLVRFATVILSVVPEAGKPTDAPFVIVHENVVIELGTVDVFVLSVKAL
jgi:hypothetical protein